MVSESFRLIPILKKFEDVIARDPLVVLGAVLGASFYPIACYSIFVWIFGYPWFALDINDLKNFYFSFMLALILSIAVLRAVYFAFELMLRFYLVQFKMKRKFRSSKMAKRVSDASIELKEGGGLILEQAYGVLSRYERGKLFYRRQYEIAAENIVRSFGVKIWLCVVFIVFFGLYFAGATYIVLNFYFILFLSLMRYFWLSADDLDGVIKVAVLKALIYGNQGLGTAPLDIKCSANETSSRSALKEFWSDFSERTQKAVGWCLSDIKIFLVLILFNCFFIAYSRFEVISGQVFKVTLEDGSSICGPVVAVVNNGFLVRADRGGITLVFSPLRVSSDTSSDCGS